MTGGVLVDAVWTVGQVADELGVTPYLKVPTANAAERQIALHEQGSSLEEIYALQVGETAESRSTAVRASP